MNSSDETRHETGDETTTTKIETEFFNRIREPAVSNK